MSQPTDYKNTKALSQSSLKTIETNPSKFYKNEYLWLIGQIPEKPEYPISDSMKIGEIVDIKLTRPKDLESEYTVLNSPPTGQMLGFVDGYFRWERVHTKGYTQPIDEDQINIIAKLAYEEAGFKRDKLQTVLERFNKEGLEYYNALRSSMGKIVVSAELMSTALGVVDDMNRDEFIGPILDLTSEKELPYDVYNQLPIYFNLEGVPLKALLDKVVVDYKNKTIQPYDIKTSSDYFWNAFGNWRYDLQGAFYYEAVHVWRDIVLKLNDYVILPFKFIVGFTNGQKPELWEMSWKDLYAGKNGGINRFGRRVKGYLELLVAYKWHVKNNKWDYPMDVYLNKGVRALNYYE